MQDSQDYYSLLGITSDANDNDIKKAYRKLAIKMHPDKGGDADLFKQITQAYSILSDSNKRSIYDECGEEGLQLNECMEGIDPFEMFKTMCQDTFINFEDIMGSNHNTRSADFVQEIAIPLEDAYQGRKKKMTIERVVFDPNHVKKCDLCNGYGKTMQVVNLGLVQTQQPIKCEQCNGRGSTISLDNVKKIETELILEIPKGTMQGHQFRFEKMTSMELGKEPGDVIFIVNYKKHPIYSIDDNNIDLNATININLYEALNGFTRTLKMLSGKYINVCSNTIVSYTNKYSIAEYGFATQDKIGNLHIRFEIEFPTMIDSNKSVLSDIIHQVKLPPSKPNVPKVYLMPYNKSEKVEIKHEGVPNNIPEQPAGCPQQ